MMDKDKSMSLSIQEFVNGLQVRSGWNKPSR
jgi:hypothetical protein